MPFPIPPRCVVVAFHVEYGCFFVIDRTSGKPRIAHTDDEFIDAIEFADIMATMAECEVYVSANVVNRAARAVS